MFDWFSQPIHLSPVARIRSAWTVLIISSVLWPITQFTIGKTEPPIVFALSWLAVVLTCIDILITSDVRVTQDEDRLDTPDQTR